LNFESIQSSEGPKGLVKSIERFHDQIPEAVAGDIVGIHVKRIARVELRRGMVCGNPTDGPPAEVESFLAQIIITGHPGFIRVVQTVFLNFLKEGIFASFRFSHSACYL
jgi:translation elongation factor EF-1alpha